MNSLRKRLFLENTSERVHIKFRVYWIREFNVVSTAEQWAIAVGLGFNPKDDSETCRQSFDPPRKGGWKLPFSLLVETSLTLVFLQPVPVVEHLTVAQINEDRVPLHRRLLYWSVERHDLFKCWPKIFLLLFHCSNRNWVYWLAHYGALNLERIMVCKRSILICN